MDDREAEDLAWMKSAVARLRDPAQKEAFIAEMEADLLAEFGPGPYTVKQLNPELDAYLEKHEKKFVAGRREQENRSPE